ncbi:MAG: hypothetical protein GY925_20540 [Actinomycetia bacterium]|nr:hypothetical protein [Actinomycetes bacterium]
MRLVLDEMHAPSVAASLVEQGWDVEAVAASRDLRGMSDEDLLSWAARDERAVVTENIVDFARIAADWVAEGRVHQGLVFTNPKRFNRATIAYPGNLIGALREFLADPPALGSSAVWWL